MTQSLLNNGKEKNLGDKLNANPKWVCGEDFKPRPLNQSGVPRVEMAREREDFVFNEMTFKVKPKKYPRSWSLRMRIRMRIPRLKGRECDDCC